MKVIFAIVFLLVRSYAFAMGARPVVFQGNPLGSNENGDVNSMEETTAGVNQFALDRGHQDQQMMEEKEMKAMKDKEAREVKLEVEEPLPIHNIKINRE